ncbi:MAG: hypothetical protein WAN81_14675 [Candidatus Binataceae bacterium]
MPLLPFDASLLPWYEGHARSQKTEFADDPKSRMVLVYCIVASIWVVVSELFLPAPFSLANRLTFVVVTGAVMALLL